MSEYVVMFPADNEAAWAVRTEAERQVTFDTDFEFGQALEARGGAVTGGCALIHSDEARTLQRGEDSEVLVSSGPFRAAAEQLSGFFIVSCDDYDALVEAAEILARVHRVVEIRPVKQF